MVQQSYRRVAAPEGAARLPGVPSLIEQKLREVDVFAYKVLPGPGGMPAATVQRLYTKLHKPLADTAVRKCWRPIIKDNGITLG